MKLPSSPKLDGLPPPNLYAMDPIQLENFGGMLRVYEAHEVAQRDWNTGKQMMRDVADSGGAWPAALAESLYGAFAQIDGDMDVAKSSYARAGDLVERVMRMDAEVLDQRLIPGTRHRTLRQEMWEVSHSVRLYQRCRDADSVRLMIGFPSGHEAVQSQRRPSRVRSLLAR